MKAGTYVHLRDSLRPIRHNSIRTQQKLAYEVSSVNHVQTYFRADLLVCIRARYSVHVFNDSNSRRISLTMSHWITTGHLTSSAVLTAEENEGRVNSLTNAKNAESAPVSKPSKIDILHNTDITCASCAIVCLSLVMTDGGELPILECDFEAFDVSRK